MNPLPKTWCLANIDDLAALTPRAITDGPFGSNLKSEHYTDNGPQVIRLQNIGDNTFLEARASISESHFANLHKHEARAGDIVVAMLGTELPRACIVPTHLGPAIVKADCVRVRTNQAVVDNRYLTYALNSRAVRAQTEELLHGVGRPRLGLKNFRRLRLPVAPRHEQSRIAQALDALLSRLQSAEATLERVQRNLERYRASVLKAAVEGRLVPTEAELAEAEGRDYEPAKSLLERILTERRRRWEEAELAKLREKGKEPKNDKWKAKYREGERLDPDANREMRTLPPGWTWASLDQVCEIWDSRRVPINASERASRRGSVPYYGATGQVGWIDGHLFDEEILLLGEDAAPFLDYLKKKAYVVSGKSWVNNHAHVLKVLGEVSITYLEAVLDSFDYRPFVSGTTRLKLSQKPMRRMPVPLPPAAEAGRIAIEIERQLAAVQSSQADAHSARLRLNAVRRASLEWAFQGKLVDQDPTDEPASVLLERIRAERAAAQPKKKTKKRASKKTKKRASKKKASKKS